MLEIALRRFHKIRYQIIAAPELDIDLREAVLVPIPEGNEAVIFADGKQCQQPRAAHDYDQKDQNGSHPEKSARLPRPAQQGNRKDRQRISIANQRDAERLDAVINGKYSRRQRKGNKGVKKRFLPDRIERECKRQRQHHQRRDA